MKKKIVALIIAAAMAVAMPFAFTGCVKDKTVIRINEVTHSVFYTPMYLADSLGYFEEEGIKIELTNGGGADKTMAAVLSGAADIGFCGPEQAIYVNIGGSSDAPKVFGQLTKRDGSFLVGRTEEKNFDWRGLEGKEILAGRQGGVPAMTFAYVLKELNVSAELNYGVQFDSMTAAFESGVADYCTMFEPVASEYQATGKGYIVASVGQQSGAIPYTCYLAKESYIKANGDKIEGFLRAITKAIKYVNETDSTTVAQKLVPYFSGTTLDSIKISVENYSKIDAWVTDMTMQEADFNRLQDVMDYSGELTRRVKYADVVNCNVAHSVYREIYKK